MGWFAQQDDDENWRPALFTENQGALYLEGLAFETEVECVEYIAEHVIGAGFAS